MLFLGVSYTSLAAFVGGVALLFPFGVVAAPQAREAPIGSAYWGSMTVQSSRNGVQGCLLDSGEVDFRKRPCPMDYLGVKVGSPANAALYARSGGLCLRVNNGFRCSDSPTENPPTMFRLQRYDQPGPLLLGDKPARFIVKGGRLVLAPSGPASGEVVQLSWQPMKKYGRSK